MCARTRLAAIERATLLRSDATRTGNPRLGTLSGLRCSGDFTAISSLLSRCRTFGSLALPMSQNFLSIDIQK